MHLAALYSYKLMARIFGYRKRLVFDRPIGHITHHAAVPLQFKQGDYRDVLEFDEYLGYDETAKAFACKRSQSGDVANFAYNGTTVAGYHWIMLNEFELPFGNTLVMSPDRFYLYRVFVAREYRGRGVAAALDVYLDNFLAREHPEKKFCTIYVFNTNVPSLRATQKTGYKLIGHIHTLDFLHFQKYWMSAHLLSDLKFPRGDGSARYEIGHVEGGMKNDLRQPGFHQRRAIRISEHDL